MSKTSYRVLGLDPGGTTGWALATVVPEERKFEWVKKGGVPMAGFNTFLRNALQKVDCVACEDFIILPQEKRWNATREKANNLYTAKLVGRVQFACWFFGKELMIFPPSRKPFGYKLNGLTYVKGKKNMHDYDGMAHARLFMREKWNI